MDDSSLLSLLSPKTNDSDVIAGDVWLNVHGEVEQGQVRFLDRMFLCGIFWMLVFKVVSDWFIFRGGCVVFPNFIQMFKRQKHRLR